jgi:hypothetical protein
MNVLREHSGFPNLIAGTLNVVVKQTCNFRVDVRVTPDDFTPDNLQRQDLCFEFCRLSSKGNSVRALRLIRNGHEFEFMAEHRIRELLGVQLAHSMSRLVASPIKRMGSAPVIVARHHDDISVAHFEYALRKCGLRRP